METPERHAGSEASAEPSRPRRRKRWGRRLLGVLFLIGILVGGAGVALVRLGGGQRLVLNSILGKVRGALAGNLVVDGIRSSSLLAGATLVGVHLSSSDGLPFLIADSVKVRYSLLSLLGGTPHIGSLVLWGPVVNISRLPGEADANVSRLLKATEAGADTVSSRFRLTIGSARIVDGTVQVFTPVEGPVPEGVTTVPSPNGRGRLRRLGLDSLSLEARDLTLAIGEAELLSGHLASLSTKVALLKRPVRVTGARGTLTVGKAGGRLDDAEIELPGSSLEGSVALGPRASGAGGWGFNLEAHTVGEASLADLLWLDDRLPRGTFSGGFGVTVTSATNVELRKVRVELEASRLDVNGRIALDDAGVQLRALDVVASPLVLRRLEPWIGGDLPLGGWLSGHATLSGRLEAMSAEGRVTLVPEGHTGLPTTMDFNGILHAVRGDPGVSDFKATLDPMNFDVVGAVFPRLPIPGVGRATLEASGTVSEGIRFTADVTHQADSLPESHAVFRGSVRRPPAEGWSVDVQSDFSPLALALLSPAEPALKLRGTASGSLHAAGLLSALHVTGDLDVGQGTVKVDGTINALRLSEGYRLSADLDRVRASDIAGVFPEPSLLSGRLVVDGRGLTPDSVEARGSVVAYASRLDGLHVDSVMALVSAAGGRLIVDTLDARVGGTDIRGSGELGMVRGSTGEARLVFHTDSLLGLRSVFMGDSVLTRDGLSALELEALRINGVDPDTLPTRAEVAMSGSMDGRLTLTGSLPNLDVEGSATLSRGVFGTDSVGEGSLRMTARRALGADREVHAAMDAQRVVALGRSYDRIRVEVGLMADSGRVSADIARSDTEAYTASGDFKLQAGRGDVVVDSLAVRLDSVVWNNTRSVRVGWDSAGVTVHDLDVVRRGDDPMHVTAEGTLAWRGASDLQVDARGLHLDRVARLVQREDLGIGGRLDLGLRLTGAADAPLIDGSFQVDEPRFSGLELSRVSGELHYRDEVAQVRVDADDHGRRVFDAEGTLPVNLALRGAATRTTSKPMDIRVRADSMDAAVALSYVKTLQDVTGTVTGSFHLGGTLDQPEPDGVLRLTRGAWTIEALGVRHSQVEGSLTVNPDRTIQVDLTGHTQEGSSKVEGKLTLSPARDPALDLNIHLQGFQAVNRRDVNGDISGQVHLGGTYRRPFLKGDLTVDHGNLFLEEFARSAERRGPHRPTHLRRRGHHVTRGPAPPGGAPQSVHGQPARGGESVRAAGYLAPLRGHERRDGRRPPRSVRSLKRDMVMVGELQALRGSYSVLGRRFEVQQGTVGFIGTPGHQPDAGHPGGGPHPPGGGRSSGRDRHGHGDAHPAQGHPLQRRAGRSPSPTW